MEKRLSVAPSALLDRISWNVFSTGNNFIHQLFSVKEERKGKAFDYGAYIIIRVYKMTFYSMP
jgi:hypothetical protein